MIARRRRNGTTVLLLVSVVVGMVGLSFASVPLYRLFCQATGVGGTTQRATAAPSKAAAAAITIRFDAETAPDLDWEFRPLQSTLTVHPGDEQKIFYRAVNRTDEPVTGTATYNVTPAKAGIYFDKLQCFCFSEQHLGGRREGRHAGGVLCRSRYLDGSEHQRRAHDHAVLYDVSNASAGASDGFRGSVGSFRELT